VPVLKTALEHNELFYSDREDSNHTLYCGTNVLQSRCQGEGNVKAVVLNTGFLTSKGELVRSIMYPPPADFKFDQDSYKFIGILAFIALLGFIYTVVSKMSRNLAAWDIIIKALDLITIVIPPALPAAMTMGKLFALNRLKKKDIYCINSRVINVSGSINCVCFDKTGTLTEDGLDMWGIVPINEFKVQDPIKESNTLDYSSNLLRAMSSCHSLAKIDDELTGDPLDFKMFESTTWQLKDSEDKQVCAVITPKTEDVEVAVLKRFQFSSTLQRMSVIVQASDSDSLDVYCKGSPEVIMSLSKKETIPNDILARICEYTVQGYRVIAVGAKVIPMIETDLVKKITRSDVESDLDFIGLLIFENKLKPQTAGVIKVLKNARMKVVMITGDNIQTAISVAKECGLVEKKSKLVNISVIGNKLEDPKLEFKFIDEPDRVTGNEIALDIEKHHNDKIHLAVTGATWSLIRQYFPEQIPKIITLGTVFARMSSEQKQQLIVELQNIGYYVAMCGDGTNDCGALKAAHVGISLSEAESSVASPFTSKESNISCVTEVVKEGRAALVTSFGVFKFMICYSLTEFISVIILYGIDANLTSMQFLFIDICLALNFASMFGITEAYDKMLFKKSPATSLLGFIPIISLTLHVILVVAFQVISYYVIQTYSWFRHFEYDPAQGNHFASYENYAVFTVSMFQYIITAVVFSKGKPYRK
ncbi:hydrolase, partial [Oryctes borbonicus]